MTTATRKNKQKLRGFTMLELMISIAIIGVMSTVILIDYPESVVKVNLANLNHKIALLIREAQIRGSSVDSRNSTNDNAIAGYGIYVELDKNDTAIIFNDYAEVGNYVNGIQVGDGRYSSSSPLDETSSLISLRKRYTFSKLCVGNGYPFICNNDETEGVPIINSMTVSFKRPNPRALFYINNDATSTMGGACLEIVSPQHPAEGHERSVRIFSSGMITTSYSGCQ